MGENDPSKTGELHPEVLIRTEPDDGIPPLRVAPDAGALVLKRIDKPPDPMAPESLPDKKSEKIIDNPSFFRERVKALEDEAAKGPEPVEFLAGQEIEAIILDDPHERQLLHVLRTNPAAPEKLYELNGSQLVSPTRPIQEIDQATREAALSTFREEAARYVSTIPVNTPGEAAKREEWLACIPNLGMRDMINFKLYKELQRRPQVIQVFLKTHRTTKWHPIAASGDG